jgi:hypothetical protein
MGSGFGKPGLRLSRRNKYPSPALKRRLSAPVRGITSGTPANTASHHAAVPLVAASLPFTADLSLDLRVLGFAAAAVMAVLILTGLLPSLQTSFGKLSSSLNQAPWILGFKGSGAPHHRHR